MLKTYVNLCGAVSLVFIGSCAEPTRDPLDFSSHQQSIIGGYPAAASLWDHTGAIVLVNEETGAVISFCSGTLISANTVITAKHCLSIFEVQQHLAGMYVAWLTGPNLQEPTETIEVVDYAATPFSEGGAVGLGHDVAVLQLAQPSLITPATPVAFDPNLEAQHLISLGYGVYSAAGAEDGQRRIGRETVQGVEGSIFESLFGDFESYVQFVMTREVTDENYLETNPLNAATLEALNERYARALLLGYEITSGVAPGDTQTCSGDSGGPLGRLTPNGTFEVVGVSSASPTSARSECDFGSIYATFGPDVFNWLTEVVQ